MNFYHPEHLKDLKADCRPRSGRSVADIAMGDGVELFWALLGDRNLEQLKNNIPKGFTWRELHPERNTTILVEALAMGLSPVSPASEEACLDLIEWLVSSGASSSQKGGETPMLQCLMNRNDPSDPSASIPLSRLSALSYIRTWKQALGPSELWKDNTLYLRKALDRIGKATSELQTRRRRAPVDEGIIDIWERYLGATASHDLTIEAADGCVTAHARMLQEASPVVRAMLASPMRERKAQQIQLQDTSSGAVRLFLQTLYTCSSQGDPDYKTALSALDLAHRWQVDVVVAILEDLVEQLITDESFVAIAEQAILKGLETLKRTCRCFGFQSAVIKDQIKKGQLPEMVLDLLRDNGTSQPVKKRKCL